MTGGLAYNHRMFSEFHLALVFMTRLPLPALAVPVPGGLARAMRWFPVVGLVVGGAAAAAYAAAHALLPASLAGLVALMVSVWLTGALHEDGLADLADGFGGGRDRERKLEIMRDSRIGSYGALAVVFSLLLRAGALAALDRPGRVAVALLVVHALSRAAIPAVMRVLAPARSDGLAAGAGQPERGDAGLAVIIALGIAAVALPAAAAVAAASGAAAGACLVAWLARRQIGGHTGDVLGAVQQAAEIFALLGVVATS